MNKRFRKFLLGTVLIATVIACVCYLIARNSYPQIQQIAIRKLLPITEPEGTISWYDWANENEVFVCSHDSGYRISIQKLNCLSGICQPVKGFNDAFARIGVREIAGLSPDRKWISCLGFQNRGRFIGFVSLDGVVHTLDSESEGRDGAWFPDSSRWIHEGFGRRSGIAFEEFYPTGNQNSRRYELPGALTIWQSHLLGFARNGAAVVGDIDWTYDSSPVNEVVVCQYKYGTMQKIRQDKIVFPCRGASEFAVLDPLGERILWQMRTDVSDVRSGWLRRTMQFFHIRSKSKAVTLFWVCNVDGSHGKIVGSLDTGKDEMSDNRPYDIKWLPSGTKFSVISGRSLWVVPLPK